MRAVGAALVIALSVSRGADLIRVQAPVPLPFEDLVSLASEDPAPQDVEARLNALRSEPFISNEATLTGAKPLAPDPPGMANILRIAEWNINRENKEDIATALSDWHAYQALALQNLNLKPTDLARAVEEAQHLEQADVIVLNEVDYGVKRTGYRNVAGDLAARLHMNYVFATEFIELTPIYLGVQKMDVTDVGRQKTVSEQYGVDPQRYLGLEGSALLSRYPILSARIVSLPDAYDWYKGEIGAISDLTKAHKWTAQKVFDERLKRQVRRGGRIMIVAELQVPGSKSGVLTIVCPHLEDYSGSKGRRKQIDFVLNQIKTIPGPVVVAGDMNTMGHNGAPVTGRRLVKGYLLNYRFWFRQVAYFFLPVPGVSYGISAINYFKNFHDPTAASIPVFASNHERGLFTDLSEFQFDDGGRFYWAGRKKDSYDRKGRTLSVTNERTWKGFTPTFEFARTYHGIFGAYKLDWILVKEPSEFRPFQGRTLRLLNQAVVPRISDHSPTTLDLDLGSTEPETKAAQ